MPIACELLISTTSLFTVLRNEKSWIFCQHMAQNFLLHLYMVGGGRVTEHQLLILTLPTAALNYLKEYLWKKHSQQGLLSVTYSFQTRCSGNIFRPSILHFCLEMAQNIKYSTEQSSEKLWLKGTRKSSSNDKAKSSKPNTCNSDMRLLFEGQHRNVVFQTENSNFQTC